MYFNDESSALKSVKDGETYGMISVHQDFTKSLYDRIIESSSSDLKSVDLDLHNKSSVRVR